jgi:ComF family protein
MLNLKRLATDFLCLIFPDYCNACGEDLYHGEQLICIKCLYDLPYTDFQHYPENPVAKLFWGRIRSSSAMAMLYYRKGTRVQRLIHQLKYNGKTDLGLKLGMLLGERLQKSDLYQTAELILPVPIHPAKERKRGYNQCTSIAMGISAVLNIPVNTNTLYRNKQTNSQTKKSRYQRFENIRSVFGIRDAGILKNKHVILVDDVITTGATIEACSKAILSCEVSRLSIVALAFTE